MRNECHSFLHLPLVSELIEIVIGRGCIRGTRRKNIGMGENEAGSSVCSPIACSVHPKSNPNRQPKMQSIKIVQFDLPRH